MNDCDNIFDLSNLSDLPENLASELRLESVIDKKIIALFKEKTPLNYNEIIVGWFRKYGQVKSRGYFRTSLYRMSKKGLIEPTNKKGEYDLPKEQDR